MFLHLRNSIGPILGGTLTSGIGFLMATAVSVLAQTISTKTVNSILFYFLAACWGTAPCRCECTIRNSNYYNGCGQVMKCSYEFLQGLLLVGVAVVDWVVQRWRTHSTNRSTDITPVGNNHPTSELTQLTDSCESETMNG